MGQGAALQTHGFTRKNGLITITQKKQRINCLWQ